MANQIEVNVEIIIHATEDRKKILESTCKALDIKEEFLEEKLIGHFGNPIFLLKTKLIKKDAEQFIRRFVSKISQVQMKEFMNNMEMYLEDSSLYLRIGKQEIVRNSINLQQNDAIKIRISVPIYKKNDLTKTYLDLLKV